MTRTRVFATYALLVGLGVAGATALTVASSPSGPTGPVAAPVASAPPVVPPVVVPPARPAAAAARKKPVLVPAKPRPVRAARAVTKQAASVVARPVDSAVVKQPPPRAVRVESPTQRGMRVLASLHYDWQRLGYRIVFLPEKKGYLGFTDGGTKTVTIWVRNQQSDLILAHTIAHELGHVLDFTHGSDAKHAAYLTLRGINPATAWYGCNGCTDYRTPAGDWAEVFAYWLAGPGDFRSQMGPPPGPVQMKAIAQLYRY